VVKAFYYCSLFIFLRFLDFSSIAFLDWVEVIDLVFFSFVFEVCFHRLFFKSPNHRYGLHTAWYFTEVFKPFYRVIAIASSSRIVGFINLFFVNPLSKIVVVPF